MVGGGNTSQPKSAHSCCSLCRWSIRLPSLYVSPLMLTPPGASFESSWPLCTSSLAIWVLADSRRPLICVSSEFSKVCKRAAVISSTLDTIAALFCSNGKERATVSFILLSIDLPLPHRSQAGEFMVWHSVWLRTEFRDGMKEVKLLVGQHSLNALRE